ncbi:MAG: hypothetical protein NMNS01_30510 [Nitrosomonas sp.]|nr:MAG: hypothetical protein NMNS01_30510 [Nitrosomonas sp.]
MADKLSYTGTIFDTSRQNTVTPEKNQSARQCHHEDVRALLRNASVPMEFKQSVQGVLPGQRLSSFTFPGEFVTGANTCLENAPSEMKICQDPDGLSATPEYVPQSFYLTDAMISLSQIEHATAGLQCFDTRPLSALITNTYFLDPCLYPPVYWCPCQSNKNKITVCVRFFVVDLCGGSKDVKTGLLKGISYTGKPATYVGKIHNDTKKMIKKTLDDANRIWKRCGIQFCIAKNSNDGNAESIYALDPNLKAVVTEVKRFPFRRTVGEIWQPEITIKDEYELCILVDKGTRKMTVNDGNKSGRYTREVTWRKNNILGKKAGEKLDPQMIAANLKQFKLDLEDSSLTEEQKKKTERAIAMLEYISVTTANETMGAITPFVLGVEALFDDKCLSVFIFEDVEDTAKKGKEAGLGELGYLRKDDNDKRTAFPGLGVFIDDAVIMRGDGRSLAHEFGHNLGENHKYMQGGVMIDQPADNLMNPKTKGEKLRNQQCKDAKVMAAPLADCS